MLLQGNTVTTLVRLLRIDTAAERAEAAELRRSGTHTAAGAVSTTATTDQDFTAQRAGTVAKAVASRTLDDRTARGLIHQIDLRQAWPTRSDQLDSGVVRSGVRGTPLVNGWA